MFRRRHARYSLYNLVLLAAAGLLAVFSVVDGALHVAEFLSLDARPGEEAVAAVGLKVLSTIIAAGALLALLGRDWKAAQRAEEQAEAADERAAAALRRLDEAIESIDQGFALFDAEDRLIRCNSRFREMYPLSVPFTPGTSFETLIRRSATRGAFADCDPKNPEGWIAARLDVHRRGAGPIDVRMTDGRWLRVDERRTLDGGNVGLRTDVTEQKRRQSELAAKTAMLETTLAFMAQGVMVWGADRRLIRFNRQAASVLGTPDGVLRQGLSLEAFLTYLAERGEFGPGDPGALMREALAQTLDPRGDRRERIRPDGSAVEIQATPAAGGLTLTTYIDVTERRAAEAALRRARDAAEGASRQKNDFVRTISHELRTPMNGVLGMLELLREAKLNDPLRGYAAAAHASAEAMLTLLDDLLDLSKIEAGRLRLDDAAFDAGDTVMAAATVMATRAAARGLSLTACIPADVDCRMRADAARLRQVLLNLVGNAVKFTERGGVSIGVARDEIIGPDGGAAPALRFEVCDSGIGIAPEAVDRLFGEFVQVHDDSARAAGGTGLGLAISKRLVEMMGGRIGVDSVRGDGSRFWFVVPTGCAGPDAERAAAATAAPLSGVRAAVIDGAAVSRNALIRQLSGWGVEVVGCGDFGAFAERAPDLAAAAGVCAADAPSPGAALIVAAVPGERGVRRLFLRPMGVAAPPPAGGVALGWPIGPAALLEALGGRRSGAAVPAVPVSAVSVSAVPVSAGGAAGVRAAPAGRVLLAEDGETNRLVATAFLEKDGYEVFHAADGEQAVEAARGMAFDLVLMDIGMPVMDGLEATRRIRALPPPAGRAPILALTADASPADRELCLAAGMNDHLSKPLERERLLRAVAYWIDCGGRPVSAAEAPAAAPAGAVRYADDALDEETLAQLERDLGRDILDGLIRQFVDEAAGRVERLTALSDDAAGLRREAHSLKSTAGTFGATRLWAAARALENSCRTSADPAGGANAGPARDADAGPAGDANADPAGDAALDLVAVRALVAGLPDLLREAVDAYHRTGRLQPNESSGAGDM